MTCPRCSARDGIAIVTPDHKRLFIAADDHPTINPAALAWCDVYGQVNLDPDNIDPNDTDPHGDSLAGVAKLVPIGPGFGVRGAALLRDWRMVAHLARHRANRFAAPQARARALHKHRRERARLHAYRPAPSNNGEVFSWRAGGKTTLRPTSSVLPYGQRSSTVATCAPAADSSVRHRL